jgi:hypothetical protein
MVCHRCNWALAPFDGNLDLGQKILDYLRYWEAQPITPAELVEGAERERRMKAIRDRAKDRKVA